MLLDNSRASAEVLHTVIKHISGYEVMSLARWVPLVPCCFMVFGPRGVITFWKKLILLPSGSILTIT